MLTQRHLGFTLVEVLIALALVAGMATLAVPPLMAQHDKSTLRQHTADLAHAITFTRQQAMLHGQTALLAAINQQWQQGWVSFIDTDHAGFYHPEHDITLMHYPAPAAPIHLAAPSAHTGYANPFAQGYVLFNAQGFPRTRDGSLANGSLQLSMGQWQFSVYLHQSGRVRTCFSAPC